jgi:hypothetical protein
MVFAMMPLLLGLGEGSEWRAPMAAVVVGGLLTSTVLTLVFIPAVYTILDDLKIQIGRMLGFLPRIAFWSRRPAASPGWTLALAPAAISAPQNGHANNGHANNGHADGTSDGIGAEHDVAERPARRNGHVRREELVVAASPSDPRPDGSYRQAPSGRRRIRLVGQPGDAPAT